MKAIDKICGRLAWIDGPHNKIIEKVAKPRIIVAGLIKRDGSPIRFKSKDKAERHIRTMGLEVKNG